jgi:RimJ/RimL family protein N-acetyltransferase
VPFDYQPVLRGKFVELKPLRAEDFDDLFAVAADPLIWEQHPNSNRHESGVFQEFFGQAVASGGALLVADVQTGRVIGTSRFHGYNEAKGEVEIGWTFLARSNWGGHYNGDLKQLMLQHAFRFVTSVVFRVGPENLRSQRAIEKIGGIRAGTGPDAAGRDSYVYRIAVQPAVAGDGDWRL